VPERVALVSGGNCMVDDFSIMHDRLFAQAGLSLERLRTFREIATAGGITAAAENDTNRQSQFSRQLRELEKFFGVELIRRGRGSLCLTAAGEELNRLAGIALHGLEEFLATCGTEPVALSIGAGESLIQWWLLPRMPPPNRLGNNITLAFENLRNEDILSSLKVGLLDFGVLSCTLDEPRIESVPLGRLEFRLFIPDNLRRNDAKSGASILRDLPLGQLSDSKTIARALAGEARRTDCRLDIRYRFSSYPQLARAILDGNVAGVMPAIALTNLPNGTVSALKLPFLDELTREVRLAWSIPMAEVRLSIGRVAKTLAAAWRVPPGKKVTGAISSRRLKTK